MDESAFDDACKRLAQEIHGARHDGEWDEAKEVWEQTYEGLQQAWERISRACFRDFLQKSIGTANNADWNRIFEAAYRQSVERARNPEGC